MLHRGRLYVSSEPSERLKVIARDKPTSLFCRSFNDKEETLNRTDARSAHACAWLSHLLRVCSRRHDTQHNDTLHNDTWLDDTLQNRQHCITRLNIFLPLFAAVLRIIMLSAVMSSVVMPSVVMPSVAAARRGTARHGDGDGDEENGG